MPIYLEETLTKKIFLPTAKMFPGVCRPDIDRILAMLPPKTTRQTVLFSATYPADIQKLCHTALRPGHELVDTVGETDIQTAEKASSPYQHLHSKPQLCSCLRECDS